jgi:transcriptional activator HAC1
MENSPAESLMSLPGENYTSLFETSSTSPLDIMTPDSSQCDDSRLSAVPEEADTPAPEDSDKKPTKKRKSWGQVLPEPKTNLPPRKRAKTADEKEQRRVERVLRNRRAAQSSRERKRQEVEALEQRNKELEAKFAEAQKANMALMEELRLLRSNNPVAPRAPSSMESFQTLSPQLFGVQKDGQGKNTIDEMINTSANATVNPASLSPSPIKAEAIESNTASMPTPLDLGAQTLDSSSDMTQRPAAMLCDLQCQSEEKQQSTASFQTWSLCLSLSLQLRMMLLSTLAIFSAFQGPITQIALSLKAGFSLHPSPRILTTIIWLATLPPASFTSLHMALTSQSSSMTSPMAQTLLARTMMSLRSTSSSSRKPTTLRIKFLRKILSSSPNLARPLQDATMEAMRFVFQGTDSQVTGLQRATMGASRDVDVRELRECLSSIELPSRELLLTLLWTLKVEEQKMKQRQVINDSTSITTDNLQRESGVPGDTSTDAWRIKMKKTLETLHRGRPCLNNEMTT